VTDFTWTVLTSDKDTDGSIKRWCNLSTLDPEEIIAEAETWLAQRMRVRKMQARTQIGLVDGDSSYALTDGLRFLDPITFHLQGYGELLYIHETELDRVRAVDDDGTLPEGPPTYVALIGDTLYFDSECDDSYTINLTYYAAPAALSASQETNLWTTNFRALFKKVLMAHAYIFDKDHDAAAPLLESAALDIAQANVTDDLARRGQAYDVQVS
jgi:hypothetical protein